MRAYCASAVISEPLKRSTVKWIRLSNCITVKVLSKDGEKRLDQPSYSWNWTGEKWNALFLGIQFIDGTRAISNISFKLFNEIWYTTAKIIFDLSNVRYFCIFSILTFWILINETGILPCDLNSPFKPISKSTLQNLTIGRWEITPNTIRFNKIHLKIEQLRKPLSCKQRSWIN